MPSGETASFGVPVTSKAPKRREGGATLVEFAMIFPMLILIVIGTIEIGLAFKDYLTMGYISREATRVGGLAGDDVDADCSILIGIGTVATGGDLAKIQQIEIFKSDESGNQGATNIAIYKGGDPSKCHVPAEVDDSWEITSVGWPATSRQTTVGTQPLDILGVRVVATHDWITNFPPFTGSFTIDESTITRLEPEAFE